MTEIESELLEILNSLQILNTINKNEEKDLIRLIEETFVVGKPRAWWLSFKEKEQYHYPDNSGLEHILELIPIDYHDDIWLIVDEDNELFHIYRFPYKYVPEVINNCQFFEYYIVSMQLDWIIAENDHGTLIKAKPKH